MGFLAPPGAVGRTQIIPNRGPHEQIYVDEETIGALVWMCLVNYDPEYGPGAKVYRPVGEADADEVRTWIGP